MYILHCTIKSLKLINKTSDLKINVEINCNLIVTTQITT